MRRIGLLFSLAALAATAGWFAYDHWKSTPVLPGVTGLRLTPMPTLRGRVELTLLDAQGVSRSLGDFRGKIVLLYFGFVRCPDACPTEMFKLAQAMQQLGPLSQRVQVLLVTLDPERDSPAMLDNYVKAFDRSFRGLWGTPAQVADAAKSFFVVYSRHDLGNDYTIDHSTGTYLIDVDRREVLYAPAATPAADFVHDIRLLLANRP